MKKLFKYFLFITILIFAGNGTQNVFAEGEIITGSASDISQTSAKLYFDININDIKFAGFRISNAPVSQSSSCNYQYSEPYDYNQTSTNFKEYTTLSENTLYYYQACAKDSNNIEYSGLEENFNTISLDETNIDIVTQPAENITYTSARLKLQIIGNGVIDSGFKFGTTSNLNSETCFLVNPEPHNNGGYYYDEVPVQLNTTYYFQACGINSAGTEFLGETLSFTVSEPGDNEIISQCLIDYVEFLPKNETNLDENSGIEYENFIFNQGKKINVIIHPKDNNKCENIKINELWIHNNNNNNVAFKIISSFAENRSFSVSGEYSKYIIAGDENCGSDQKCDFGVWVKYGIKLNGANWQERTFTTYESPSYNEQPSTEVEKKKGRLLFKEKSGEQEWEIWDEGNPQHTGTADPDYDASSPCYVDPGGDLGNGDKAGSHGGYKEDCYELLAPIAGIGDYNEGGRVAIRNLKDYDLSNYVNTMFQVALGVLMVLAVVMVVVAGVEYMTVESIYGKSAAKSHIVGALTGLILALGIFLIIKTINPKMLNVNFGSNISVATIDAGGGLGMDLSQQPPRGSGSDPRSIDPVWAMENAPVLKFTQNGNIVPVKACDVSKMTTFTAFGGKTITVREELKPTIVRIDQAWQAQGSSKYPINTFGSYNCRTITEGDRSISTHSYGITLDINSANNPYGPTLITDMPKSFRNLFISEGFGWGGSWSSKKDAMHFSKQNGQLVGGGQSSNEQGDQIFN